MHPVAEKIWQVFRDRFGEDPLLIRSPGRINVIGEHTDYNEGFVLPGAVQQSIYLALAPGKDSTCHLIAVDLNDEYQCRFDELRKTPKRWPNYLMGVVDQLLKAGKKLRGFTCVFGGDIPIAAGLSSSAALEAGLMYGLNVLFHLGLSPMEVVRLAQKAENDFVGVQCGIMDQLTNIYARSNQVLYLDCRTLDFEYVTFPNSKVSIVLCDTGKSRELAVSEYNARRYQCEQAVAFFQQKGEKVHSLRDVSPAMCQKYQSEMDPTIYRRALFVAQENERVAKAVEALRNHDFSQLGQLLFQSHQGLRDLYEVSCPELDFLVEQAQQSPGVYGARLMGAGFGGCTINVVATKEVQQFIARVISAYRQAFGQEPQCYKVQLAGGTQVLTEQAAERR